MELPKNKLILASKSPRRSQLLSEAGFSFDIKTREVEETYPPDLPVRQVAEYLAELKANAAKSFIKNDEILLAADTIVLQNEVIFGKPKDKTDAIRILKQLSGKMHEVITGVCLLSTKEDGTPTKKSCFSSISKVYFEELTEEEILFYIDKYQPYDKAGAYAIQEWIGHCKISKIEGTYSNIMGLPVEMLYRKLAEFR